MKMKQLWKRTITAGLNVIHNGSEGGIIFGNHVPCIPGTKRKDTGSNTVRIPI